MPLAPLYIFVHPLYLSVRTLRENIPLLKDVVPNTVSLTKRHSTLNSPGMTGDIKFFKEKKKYFLKKK
ncbi:MAG: hypothetical protein IJ599_01385 [Alphaproteobacteria bacterium]|nr:hypothetical protein [Alphaproteobacteria bacterium]